MTATAKPFPEFPRLRVAVVDDSAAVRQSLSLLLAARGFSVDAFSGADELLLDVGAGDHDCYVIDLKLDGMDGFGLLSALRSRGVSAPAIMISGWEVAALESAALRAGFIALVRKPMMDTSLVRVLREVLPD